MADHTINIDVFDLTVPELNSINIAIINLPNPVIGYSANAEDVKALIQIPRYTVFESGTSNVINGRNYYDYFPEEGGGGGGTSGYTVNVTTVPNATVTLSKTEKTYTNTADSTGHASFKSVEVGTYTVTATIDDAESDSTTVDVTDFSATEDSFASLTISALTNCTITVTNGTITKTLSYTGTPVTQYVSLGTWTVSTTIDSTLITRTVSVTSYTDQTVHLSPATIVSRTVDFQNFTSYSTLDVSGSNVYTNMKRCNVADDGTINAFDGDAGYVENGTNGQVMVYVPKFWYKLDVSESGSLDGNNIRKGTWSIADGPLKGFKLHPAFLAADGVTELDYFLYGAFEGVGQNSNGTYSTSYNTTAYKLGSVGGNSYSPSNNFTRTVARTMAANRGTGWYQAGVKQTMALQMLFAVEYGFNSQLTVGYGVVNTSAASKTGITTGSTTSGTKNNQTTPVSWRGIENLWGNVFDWIDGLNVNERVPYVCDTFNFVDDTSTGYTQIAFSLPSNNNYVSALGYDSNNDWILLPSEATDATKDSAIGDSVASNTGWRIACIGGDYGSNYGAGFFYWNLDAASSLAAWYRGSRIMYIPANN